MTYLREVRLNRVHEALTAAAPDATTVSTIAARWGFHHPGRFAATYRKKFGRMPTEPCAKEAAGSELLRRCRHKATGDVGRRTQLFRDISLTRQVEFRVDLGLARSTRADRRPWHIRRRQRKACAENGRGRRGSSRPHNREGDETDHDTLCVNLTIAAFDGSLRKLRERRPRASQPHLRGT